MSRSNTNWLHMALVEATLISGPAWVRITASASRATLEPTTLHSTVRVGDAGADQVWGGLFVVVHGCVADWVCGLCYHVVILKVGEFLVGAVDNFSPDACNLAATILLEMEWKNLSSRWTEAEESHKKSPLLR